MHRYYNQRGFTLIEIMSAATITAILMGCVLSFIIQGHTMLKISNKENEMQQNLAIGMDKITRELLTADQLRFIDEQVGFQPEKDDQVLTFTCNKKLVKYYVDEENELSRNYSGVGLPIANHIKTLRIKYFDASGAQITPGTPATAVAMVTIELTGCLSGIKNTTLTTAVTLRTAALE